MALDPALLTWLESLSNNSIDSWEWLKKVFINNFQGRSLVQVLIMILLNVNRNVTSSYGPIHTISSMWRSTIANCSEEDIIDCFYNGITNPGIYTDFG
jgi:hypothetical protein